MSKIYLLLLLLLFSNLLKAQFDKEKFEKIFDDEVFDSKYSSRENHSALYQHMPAQEVPAWVTSPPISNTNAIYSIGISDPEMDSTEAYNLAIYRAQIMANVLYKSTTQLLCDFFLNEKDHSTTVVYEHFTRINATLPLEGQFELVASYRDNYDETLVLIKYIPKIGLSAENSNKVKLELYKNEVQGNAYGNYESVYELWVQSNSQAIADPMFYQFTELGKRYDVLSAVGNEQKTVPIYKLTYLGLPNEDSLVYCYFSHGLWKEYLKSVMLFIIDRAREKPENIQHLSESHQKNSFDNLTRGISVNKMRFAYSGLVVSNGEIKVQLDELPIEE